MKCDKWYVRSTKRKLERTSPALPRLRSRAGVKRQIRRRITRASHVFYTERAT